MATKKNAIGKSKARLRTRTQEHSSHRLQSLLQTVRCIAQYEDALCELTHEVKASGILTSKTVRELRSLLDQIPSDDYLHDLRLARELVATVSSKDPAAKALQKAVRGGGAK